MKKNYLKIYEKLGALWWQKVVFAVEKLKFKVLKSIPHVVDIFDFISDFNCKRDIRKNSYKVNSEELIANIKKITLKNKLAFRKELNYEENINYHIDPHNPDKFMKYLLNNKKIHVEGIIGNTIILGIVSLVLAFFPSLIGTYSLGIIVIELICAFINFECINLQNYNIKRLENLDKKETLVKHYEKLTAKNIKQYGNISKKLSKTLDDTSQVPTVDDIISCVETYEEEQELVSMLQHQKKLLLQKRNKRR